MSNNPRKKKHGFFLNKLYQRQISGELINTGQVRANFPVFGRINERLVFQLDKVFPLSALEAGHILLGFSKCGQFLMTYTHSVELEVNLLTVMHKYKLHWWSFVPYRQAAKVTEVTLFSDQGVHLPLKINLCYWHNDSTRILVHGNSTQTEAESIECHLTITSVPTLNGCRDCHRVAQSYGDDELAANWDSCVRFSCLRHGWTLHSSYSTVLPYPSFISPLPLRSDGTIVINTANFLHVLTVQVEFPSSSSDPSSSVDDLLIIHPGESWEDCSSSSILTTTPTRSITTPNMSPNMFVSQSSTAHRKYQQQEDVDDVNESEYDFMEEAPELPRETISAFRKRRLADKKYEFKDENAENVPLKVMRKRRDQEELEHHSPVVVSSMDRSKDVNEDWEWNFSSHSNDVLRPFNSNIPNAVRSPEWENEEQLRPQRDRDPPLQGSAPKLPQTPNCVAEFHRRYFEVDDELVSVITDIEDDDLSCSTGYHNALPLEVHGAGYAQMQMVSNAKALRLKVPHVSVRQLSIDTEQLCHEMAQRLCTLSKKKYWFCTDFNVEIIDFCWETNDVVATAFMLVEADVIQHSQ